MRDRPCKDMNRTTLTECKYNIFSWKEWHSAVIFAKYVIKILKTPYAAARNAAQRPDAGNTTADVTIQRKALDTMALIVILR